MWWRRARISKCKTARFWKQERRAPWKEKNTVNMGAGSLAAGANQHQGFQSGRSFWQAQVRQQRFQAHRPGILGRFPKRRAEWRSSGRRKWRDGGGAVTPAEVLEGHKRAESEILGFVNYTVKRVLLIDRNALTLRGAGNGFARPSGRGGD